METSSTTRLPNEILFNIFSHFCLHCQDHYNQDWDERPLRAIKPCREEQQPNAKSWYSIERNTLFAACLASKGLRDIAQPILYHEFVLGYGDSWKSDLYDWGGRLISFMQTLARRPELCRQVKVVYINTHLFTSNDEGKRATLLEAARALKIDLPAVWKQRASNILASEAEDWPEVYSIFLSTYLDERVVNLPLKTLDLGIAANSLIELAPTLRTLNLHDYSGDLSAWDTELPNLKTLRITNDYLSANTLRRLLDACTGGLVAFEFEAYKRVAESPRCGFEDYENYTPAPPHMLRDSHFQPSDVIKILQKHKNTLRILHLDLTNREYRTKKIPLDVNLKDFSTLQHVFINAFQLLGSEENIEIEHEVLIRLLPRSIVSLVIHRENFRRRCRVKEALFALADSKSRSPDHFPFLKHVACNLRKRSTTVSSLRSLFEPVGVEFCTRVESLNKLKPYLSGHNGSSSLGFPVFDDSSDAEL
ncbi:hypothetical protein FG05_10984 [Fusarium graminearum]|nr:hypothetical protein FG05_10984 [Fusarium graminearum]